VERRAAATIGNSAGPLSSSGSAQPRVFRPRASSNSGGANLYDNWWSVQSAPRDTGTKCVDERSCGALISPAMMLGAHPDCSVATRGKVLLRLGLILAILTCVIASQFYTTHHELTVRHAVCFQHGEVIDVDDSAPSVRSADLPAGVELLAGTDKPRDGHHQHCLLVSSRSSRLFKTTVSQIVCTRASALSRTTAAAEQVAHSSTAIYLAAPKHSPPLV
jgi:hypothetical protein